MAAQRRLQHDPCVEVSSDAPLIAIPGLDEGADTVTYFTSEQAADAAMSDDIVQTALSLAGVWGDLSWEEFEAELYRIRHESEPTPPLEP